MWIPEESFHLLWCRRLDFFDCLALQNRCFPQGLLYAVQGLSYNIRGISLPRVHEELWWLECRVHFYSAGFNDQRRNRGGYFQSATLAHVIAGVHATAHIAQFESFKDIARSVCYIKIETGQFVEVIRQEYSPCAYRVLV